jgi:hypothetical protein
MSAVRTTQLQVLLLWCWLLSPVFQLSYHHTSSPAACTLLMLLLMPRLVCRLLLLLLLVPGLICRLLLLLQLHSFQ